ncbi:MAG TPA: hypothetical protein ACFYDZ_11010, partial [Candidatus Brocadiaceae bacterium]
MKKEQRLIWKLSLVKWQHPASDYPHKTELESIPLIVPPIRNKIRNHPLFRLTDKDRENALLTADIVVTIGWG